MTLGVGHNHFCTMCVTQVHVIVSIDVAAQSSFWHLAAARCMCFGVVDEYWQIYHGVKWVPTHVNVFLIGCYVLTSLYS